MAKLSKRVRVFKEKVDPQKAYPLEDAVSLLKEFSTVKFNETVEVAVNLGIDARKSDQAVRGATTLPFGTGSDVRVAVFTQGENAEKATAAGADLVGMDDLAEQIKGGMCVLAGFGLPNVMQHFLRLGLGSLGQIVQDIAGFMHPTPLLAGCRENFFQRCPEPHGTITCGQFWSGEPTSLEAEKHFAPALRAFPDAVFNGQEVLLAKGVDPDHNEHAEPVIGASQAAVYSVSPDVDPFVTAQISLAPVTIFRRPLAFQARDRLRRKPSRVRAKEHLKRRAHLACRDALQRQPRDRGFHAAVMRIYGGTRAERKVPNSL